MGTEKTLTEQQWVMEGGAGSRRQVAPCGEEGREQGACGFFTSWRLMRNRYTITRWRALYFLFFRARYYLNAFTDKTECSQ